MDFTSLDDVRKMLSSFSDSEIGFRATKSVKDDTYYIITGFRYYIGDEIFMVLSKDEVGWYLSDGGRTIQELEMAGLRMTPSREDVIISISDSNRARFDGREIWVEFDHDHPSDSVRDMIQSVLQVQAVIHLSTRSQHVRGGCQVHARGQPSRMRGGPYRMQQHR